MGFIFAWFAMVERAAGCQRRLARGAYLAGMNPRPAGHLLQVAQDIGT